MQTTRVSLLQRMRSKNDSGAWSSFVHIYTPLVSRWVTDLGIGEKERNDVVQEVFMVLLSKISTFRYDSGKSFRGWLRTVTINKSRDFLRKRNRASEPRFLEHIEAVVDDETQLLTEKEYREYVARAALELMKKNFSETTWRACWLHVAEGKTAPQVAEELGVSTNAVYLARGRVLNRLRHELDGFWE